MSGPRYHQTMRALVAWTMTALLLNPAATNAADKYVELVLDGSVAMWRTLDDGAYRFVAVRAAVESLIAGLAGEGS